MTGRPEALFLTVEPLGERLAGPAIRALELARAVARSGAVGRVRLVSLAGCDRDDADVELSAVGPDLLDQARDSGVVVLQGDVLNRVPGLADLDVPIVVDAYDPFHLEQLEQTRGLAEADRLRIVRDCVRALNDQLGRADLVLCASERQRALWLGHLAALGRVNPLNYDASPELAGLLAVVPFGTSVPDRSAVADRGAVVGASVPGLAPEDVLLVWGGGIYPWFDTGVLLDAMARLAGTHPRLKLLFLGTRHPLQPDVDSPEVAALRARAAEEGLLDRTVFLHPGWVPYDERHDWLGGADVGVSTHHPHLETEFSYRTRVVDYLAAGLPVVTTDGDAMADLVRATGCGVVVPPHDPEALAGALAGLADDAVARRAQSDRAADAAADLAWDRVAAPLVEFSRAPRRAPDLVALAATRALLEVARGGPVRRLRAAMSEGGIGLLADRALRRLGRRAAPGSAGPDLAGG
jgi:glycosyltransferase involved in cell wall biosynthesis